MRSVTFRSVECGSPAASIHVYRGAWCPDSACWNSQIAQVAVHKPVVIGEFGETDCAGGFVGPLMTWADSHHVSYTAWHWWPVKDVGCANYALITDYSSGAPSGYGRRVKSHLIGQAGRA